jgi:hypothetical protein
MPKERMARMTHFVMVLTAAQAEVVGLALDQALRAERAGLAAGRAERAGQAADGCRERMARIEEVLHLLGGCVDVAGSAGETDPLGPDEEAVAAVLGGS